MSGGSFNYLYDKDVGELLGGEADSDLSKMRDQLAELGWAEDAAAETAGLILELRAARVRVDAVLRRLQPVWRAVEWWTSCDSNEQSVRDALAEYRGVAP